jgi:hypothetical protein
MNKFDEREHAFENKFAHDAETDFKIQAKATKLLGNWAASKLNFDNNNTLKYATKLVESHINSPEDAVIEFVANSFKEHNISFENQEIIDYLAEFKEQAKKIILGE